MCDSSSSAAAVAVQHQLLIWPFLFCHGFSRFCLPYLLRFLLCRKNVGLFLWLPKENCSSETDVKERFPCRLTLEGWLSRGAVCSQVFWSDNVLCLFPKGMLGVKSEEAHSFFCPGKRWVTVVVLCSVWWWSTWSNKISDVANERLKGQVTVNSFWRTEVKYYGKYRG